MPRWRVTAIGFLFLAAGLTSAATRGVARADDGAPFRMVVRVPDDPEALLFKRVTAHLSDLPVQPVVATSPLEGSFPQQIAAAEAIVVRDGARAVMWLDEIEPEPARARLYVYIGDPPGRLVRRRIEARSPAVQARGPAVPVEDAGLGRTTLVEIAAIMARSTVQEMLAGAVVGIPRAEAVAVEAAPPAPAAPPARLELAAVGRLGWQPTAFTQSVMAPVGLALEVALAAGRWRFGLAASGTTSARLADDLAEIDLAKLTGGLLLRAEVARVSRLSLELGGQVGIAAFRRVTVQSAQGTVRTDTQTTYTPALAPEAILRFGPFAGGVLAVVLGVGADVVPGRPTIAYDLAGTLSPAHRIWPIQPRAQLLLEVLLAKL